MVGVNPVRSLRVGMHLTQRELAEQACIATNTLVYTEKGMYQNIPQGLLGILLERNPMIPKLYKEWIWAKRREVAAPFNINPPYPDFYDHTTFRETVLHMTMNEYAANFCIERRSVYAVENGQTRVPKRIVQAITEAFGEEFGRHFYKSLTPQFFRGTHG